VADLGNVKITADAATNSLIIQGSSAAFKEVDNIIRLLDQRKSQVFVEADIIDVNIGKNLEIGGSAFAGFNDNNFVYPYGWKPQQVARFSALSSGTAGTNATQAAGILNSLPNNAVVGILSKQSINVAGLNLTPGAFIFALKQDSNANVLQTPSLLVGDNEEADFVSNDQEVLFLRSSNTATSESGEKAEKLDAELSLKIKPQISKADVVNMSINLKADSFGRRDGGGRPVQTIKRAFNTKLSVQNGQTIVISGLQKDIEIDNEDKVPLLGDIPIIGWLFRNSSTIRQKTNLMIFLTPYVVRESSDLARIYDKKLSEQKEFLEKFYGEDYRDKEVFQRLPNAADGRVPPPKLSQEAQGELPALEVAPGGDPGSGAAAPALQLPSEDPDPIVVPSGDAGSFSGGGGGGGAPPPPPPPPPPGDGGDGGDGGGE
jgi:general secretion pathway protein D